jgi:hypothetical protein
MLSSPMGVLAVLLASPVCVAAQPDTAGMELPPPAPSADVRTVTLSMDLVDDDWPISLNERLCMNMPVPLGTKSRFKTLGSAFHKPVSVELTPALTDEGVDVDIALQELAYAGSDKQRTEVSPAGEHYTIHRVFRHGEAVALPWSNGQLRVRVSRETP